MRRGQIFFCIAAAVFGAEGPQKSIGSPKRLTRADLEEATRAALERDTYERERWFSRDGQLAGTRGIHIPLSLMPIEDRLEESTGEQRRGYLDLLKQAVERIQQSQERLVARNPPKVRDAQKERILSANGRWSNVAVDELYTREQEEMGRDLELSAARIFPPEEADPNQEILTRAEAEKVILDVLRRVRYEEEKRKSQRGEGPYGEYNHQVNLLSEAVTDLADWQKEKYVELLRESRRVMDWRKRRNAAGGAVA